MPTNKLQYGNNCNHWKILDLVLDLNCVSSSNPNPTPNPAHSPKHETLNPNHQFYLSIRYMEYYFVHVHMAWSQKFRKSEIKLDTCNTFQKYDPIWCISKNHSD